jgi:hypothetical protein
MYTEIETLITALSQAIARDIMETGNDPNGPAKRIQFMGGKWPDNEIPLGGLNEIALSRIIHKTLRKRLCI